jgi:glucokinase
MMSDGQYGKCTARERFSDGLNGEGGMAETGKWTVGVDLGGTKVEVARVDEGGAVRDSVRTPTRVGSGPIGIIADIVSAIKTLQTTSGTAPLAVGVGTAGQIDAKTGVVVFSPNLDWHEVPLREDLEKILALPVVVTNDVRAVTWGEWLHGAGRGFDDLICLFVGTGIGGGVVSAGRVLTGCTNTAGELGHMTIAVDGPQCTCGNRGCLEAMAGGWAIARQAQEMVLQDKARGRTLLEIAGSVEAISAATVAQGADFGDPLSLTLTDRVPVRLPPAVWGWSMPSTRAGSSLAVG